MVTGLGAAPSATEAGLLSATSGERSDERSQGGGLAHVAHDEDVGAGGGESEDDEGEQAPAEISTVVPEQPPAGDLGHVGEGEDVGARGCESEDDEGEETPTDLRTDAGESGLRCARCKRAGVEEIGGEETGGADGTRSRRVRPARRRRSAPWPMTSSTEMAKPCPIGTIETTLGRARCCQPVRIERMKQSLAAHGQLTPLVAVPRPEGVELVDGFKRLAAATTLGWTTMVVAVTPLDETGQWATMLLLNRGPSSMTALEEGLVLRELAKTGLTQAEIAALCSRHKSWVSRRIGLVERLHPELLESMKLGMLHPGSARRLLSLPPGNQLELAAVVGSARLGPRDTELLVSLWHRTKDPVARRALLSEPRASLLKHHPETRRPPVDPRLSPEGQRLCRGLHRLEAVVTEASRRLGAPPPRKDLEILSTLLRTTEKAVSRLTTELGSARTIASAFESEGSGATN
jgi:ParB-like chromosome segregation protein Spo0J